MILPNEHFWKVFKETPGALSCSEAIAIMNITPMVKDSSFLELGTFRGKSAMAALHGLKNGSFDLVDPEFENESTCEQVLKNIGKTNNVAINLINGYSTDIIPNYNSLNYVFVDSGSHQDGLPMSEVKLLEDRLMKDGIIAFHDLFSQFHEVEDAYRYLLGTGKYEEIPINWNEINAYVIENNLEAGNNSWHHTELATPNFLGALKRI